MRIQMVSGGVANVPTSEGTKTIRHNQVLEISVADYTALSAGMKANFNVLTPHAGQVDFVPAGTIAATTVQAAIEELDSSATVNMRNVRVTTGAIAAGATADVVVDFAPDYADTNYTVSPAVEDAGNDLRIRNISARAVGTVTIRVENTDGLNAATGTLHVLIFHD